MRAEDDLTLCVTPVASDVPLLGTAQVTVTDADGTVLAELPAAWQEVGENG